MGLWIANSGHCDKGISWGTSKLTLRFTTWNTLQTCSDSRYKNINLNKGAWQEDKLLRELSKSCYNMWHSYVTRSMNWPLSWLMMTWPGIIYVFEWIFLPNSLGLLQSIEPTAIQWHTTSWKKYMWHIQVSTVFQDSLDCTYRWWWLKHLSKSLSFVPSTKPRIFCELNLHVLLRACVKTHWLMTPPFYPDLSLI